MALVRLPGEINGHRNEWVAISRDNRLVGHGKTPEDAISSASSSGHGPRDFSLMWVPDEWPGVRMPERASPLGWAPPPILRGDDALGVRMLGMALLFAVPTGWLAGSWRHGGAATLVAAAVGVLAGWAWDRWRRRRP